MTLTAVDGAVSVSASFNAVAKPDVLTVVSVPADGALVGDPAGVSFAVRVTVGGTAVAGRVVVVSATNGRLVACGAATCSLTTDAAGDGFFCGGAAGCRVGWVDGGGWGGVGVGIVPCGGEAGCVDGGECAGGWGAGGGCGWGELCGAGDGWWNGGRGAGGGGVGDEWAAGGLWGSDVFVDDDAAGDGFFSCGAAGCRVGWVDGGGWGGVGVGIV